MSVILAGVLVVVQLFVMRLSYSGRTFARVSMRCDRASLFTGLLELRRTPRSSLLDNASTAVSRILRGASRKENALFAEFRGGLMLDVRFAAPGKGNEKGGVEGVHGYIEDTFFGRRRRSMTWHRSTRLCSRSAIAIGFAHKGVRPKPSVSDSLTKHRCSVRFRIFCRARVS